MESFVYQDLNKASRDKDESKIKFYGAFAAALSYIIYSANKHRTDMRVLKQSHLFRGVKLEHAELENYYKDNKIQLIGYTSTSKKFKKALEFATDKCPPEKVPVVFEIFFKGKSGLFELDDGITAFPGEQEVLLQDGLEYRVLSNEEIKTEDTKQKFNLIKLQYPA